MTRKMYDSTDPNDIPADANMVAGYVDGLYAWSNEGWRRFPNATKVRIAVFAGTNDGHVLDVENQDATPDEAPGWVVMRRATGVNPSVYCNRSNWPAVRAAFHSRGIAEPPYWIATLDGTQFVDGAVAVQYIGQPGSGGHFDLSLVPGLWPGIDTIPQEDDMVRFATPFSAVYHDTGAHWSANSDGSDDQGAVHINEGIVVTVIEQSADGRYVRPELGSLGHDWWLPLSTVSVVVSGQAGPPGPPGPPPTTVPPHTHTGSVTVT